MTNLVSIKQLTAADLQGKRVFLRLDLNVPTEGDKVANTYRLEKAKPTIDYLLERGAKLLIASHRSEAQASLEPVANYYRQLDRKSTRLNSSH